jgi:hypothetical protein
MVELMNSPDERIRLVACDKVLERAYGKVKEFDATELPAGRPDVSNLSDSDLREIKDRLRKAGVVLPAPPIQDAEVIEGEIEPSGSGIEW